MPICLPNFSINVTQDLFLTQLCVSNDHVRCVGRNPDKSATRIWTKSKRIYVQQIRSRNPKIYCDTVAQIWTSVWQSWHFQGDFAPEGWRIFQSVIIEGGICQFWEEIWVAGELRGAKVESGGRRRTAQEYATISLRSPIAIVFKSWAVLLAIAFSAFLVELIQCKTMGYINTIHSLDNEGTISNH